MFKSRNCPKQIGVYLLFILNFFPLVLSASASESKWWDTDWEYRGKITVLSPRLESEIDSASFIFYPPEQYISAGVDIRIIDEEGRETPYKIKHGEKDNIVIDFRVDNPSNVKYYIYFGNPKAERVEYIWEPTTGGLFLETRESSSRSHPKDLSQMQRLIETSTKSYGRRRRGRIDDLENPFGSNENYLSIYRGNIFCPQNGTYRFATNSDDASFLLVDGKLVASWPGGHEKEDKSRPLSNKWAHSGEVYLTQGVHLIQYYQEDFSGAQLSRAGWKKPGDKEVAIIPDEAFIDKLKARQISVQVYKKTLNAFFFTEKDKGIVFNRQIPELISFQFQDGSTSKDSGIISWQWDFGDGRTSSEKNPLHVYPVGKAYKVKLEIRDINGLSDTYEQCIQVTPSSEPKSIKLGWGISSPYNIFYPEESLKLQIWVKNYSDTGVKLELVWETCDQKNDNFKQGSGEFALGPNEAGEKDIALGRCPVEQGMNFYLKYGGNVIAERQIKFLDRGSDFKGLKIVERHVEDVKGNLVLFRILPTAREKGASYTRLNIVVLGASLYNKDSEENYQKILKELFRDYYGDKFKIDITNVEIPEDKSACSGLLGICQLDEVIKLSPDLVLCSLGMNEVINHLPIEEFRRSLAFLTSTIKSRGISDILLIPPPVIDRIVSSMDVAVTIKGAGLKQETEIIDLFSLFPREESEEEVYFLYPNRDGQRLIAEHIFETLKKNVSGAK